MRLVLLLCETDKIEIEKLKRYKMEKNLEENREMENALNTKILKEN